MPKERTSLFELSTKDPVELQSLILKSKLSAIIRLALAERQLTQAEAAKLLETTQPRMSELLNGKLSKFSVDFQLNSLFKMGYSLDLAYDPTNLKAPLKISLKQDKDAVAAKPLCTAKSVVRTLVERGDGMGLVFTRAKLQKLLYAAHGKMLAVHGRPLIDEPFSAWQNGPLVESLYHELRVYGLDNIGSSDNYIQGWGRVPAEDTDAIAVIDVVLTQMGSASVKDLMDWTCVEDGPWHRVYHEDTQQTKIDNADIRRHFKKHLALQP